MFKNCKLAATALLCSLLATSAFAQSSESILSLSVDIRGPDNNQASIITPVKIVQTQDKNVIILQPPQLDINFVDIKEDGSGGLILKIKSKHIVDKKDVTATLKLHATEFASLEISGSTDLEKVSYAPYSTNTQRIELPEVSLASLPVNLSINKDKQKDTQVLTFDANNLTQELKVTVTVSKLL